MNICIEVSIPGNTPSKENCVKEWITLAKEIERKTECALSLKINVN